MIIVVVVVVGVGVVVSYLLGSFDKRFSNLDSDGSLRLSLKEIDGEREKIRDAGIARYLIIALTVSSPAELYSDWYLERSCLASLTSMSSTLCASSASTCTEESSLTVMEPLETKYLVSLPSSSVTCTTPGLSTAAKGRRTWIKLDMTCDITSS